MNYRNLEFTQLDSRLVIFVLRSACQEPLCLTMLQPKAHLFQLINFLIGQLIWRTLLVKGILFSDPAAELIQATQPGALFQRLVNLVDHEVAVLLLEFLQLGDEAIPCFLTGV